MDWALGMGFCYSYMGRAHVFLFLFALRGLLPESTPGPNLCKYTHIRIRTYTYKCIYIHIYIFMREGGSSNAEAQNHDLSRKVIRPEQLSWPRTW